jgi:hypothetical protein
VGDGGKETEETEEIERGGDRGERQETKDREGETEMKRRTVIGEKYSRWGKWRERGRGETKGIDRRRKANGKRPSGI